jgi:hypothetical protein
MDINKIRIINTIYFGDSGSVSEIYYENQKMILKVKSMKRKNPNIAMFMDIARNNGISVPNIIDTFDLEAPLHLYKNIKSKHAILKDDEDFVVWKDTMNFILEEYIDGKTLTSIWDTLSNEKKDIYSNKLFDITKRIRDVKSSFILTRDGQYSDTNEEVCLSHNDLHFSNVIINKGALSIIDWECAGFYPKHYEIEQMMPCSKSLGKEYFNHIINQ